MKNKNLIWAIIAVVLVLAAAWVLLGRAPAPSPVKPVKVSTPEAAALPKVITLYQKGDGESDLAAFVAKELSQKCRAMASFRLINVLDEPQMAEYFGVSSQPAVIFLLPSGRVYTKHEGYLDQKKIISILLAMQKS